MGSKITVTVHLALSTETFDSDDLTEMLASKGMYRDADNLPKWLRWNGGYKSWKAVWTAIEGWANSAESTIIYLA